MLFKEISFSVSFIRVLFSSLILLNSTDGLTVLPTNDFLLRFDKTLLTTVKTELSKVNITFVKQVSRFERIHAYIAEMWTKSAETTHYGPQTTDREEKSRVSTYFDMGVEGAWRQNYTGTGILIAVTDVGVNPDVEDLQPNIDIQTSYNAVDEVDSTNILPEQFDNPETMSSTDHGNRCAGMIAALKNTLCGDGVAYRAKIAVLKIFNAHYEPTEANFHHVQIKFEFPSIADGFHHRIDKVDIYSNSWANVKDFVGNLSGMDLVTEAIKEGATRGRCGKGAIHVFPVFKVADPFANSIYTVAVNSMGRNGVIPEFSHVCACTLTTAYGEGCDRVDDPECDTSHMMTASRRVCTLDFKGTSASTAIVSGIIGLALQANPNLSWREVQDIVVRASDRKRDMEEYGFFLKNGAGKFYHKVFGFGLLNATKLVTLAKNMQPLPKQVKIQKTSLIPRPISHRKSVEVYVTIPCIDSLCVASIEQVVATINFSTPKAENCEIILISPAATSSLLMDRLQANDKGPEHYEDIDFLSVHFWGEEAAGQWTLVMTQYGNFAPGSFEISDFRLSVFGTGVSTSTGEFSIPETPTIVSTHATAPEVSTPSTVSTTTNHLPAIVAICLGGVMFVGACFLIVICDQRRRGY